MYGNRSNIRSQTVLMAVTLSVLMVVMATIIIGSDASDADTTDIQVSYVENSPIVGGPAMEITNDGSLNGRYSATLLDSENNTVDTFDITEDLTGLNARIGIDPLEDGVYTLVLTSLTDTTEIHQVKFIVGEVEVTADTEVSVKLGSTGMINLTLPQWLDASDVIVTAEYDEAVMTITSGTGTSFTVTPASLAEGSLVKFSVSFNGTEVATAQTSVSITYADVEGVSITGPNEVVVGADFNLVAEVNPDNANPGVIWSGFHHEHTPEAGCGATSRSWNFRNRGLRRAVSRTG